MDDFKDQFLRFTNLNAILKERIKNKIFVTNGNIFKRLENLSNIDYIEEIKQNGDRNVDGYVRQEYQLVSNRDIVENFNRGYSEEVSMN